MIKPMKKFTNKILWLLIFAVISIGALVHYHKIDVKKFFDDISNKNFTEPYNDDYPMSVHILNVGRADSILIKCEDKNILIDAADKDVNDVVCSYLRRNNVKKLDLVVVTHPHRDHIGQMSNVIDQFDIVRFIMPRLKDGVMSTTKTYERLSKSLDSKHISPQEPTPGTDFNVGNAKIEILAPNAQYDNINNYSVVLKITYGNRKFLFTGDAETESEKDMIDAGFDLNSDVLKVGHHGSKTSTSQKFLDAVKPKYAVISVGPDQNNLPKKETLNRLSKNGINVFRTDLNGNIIIATDGNEIKINKERE